MSPPELTELTPHVYARKTRIASEKREKIRNPQDADSRCDAKALLDEKSLAKLVPAHEGFHGAETAEEILDFAVLENFLRRAERGRGNHLESIGIRDAVALEAFGLFAVEHGEGDSAGPQKIGKRGHYLFAERRLEIVQEIPQQHGIKRCGGISQIRLQESRRPFPQADSRPPLVRPDRDWPLHQPNDYYRCRR